MKICYFFRPLFSNITPPVTVLLSIITLMLIGNGFALLTPWLTGQFTQSLLAEKSSSLPLSYQQILAIWFFMLPAQSTVSYYSRVLLRNSTVTENILFGRPDASLDEVRAAARYAHALSFTENLSDGFDTIIGDQGVKLSGGQKQRLSLARTLLKNPAILILDEATAMFDPEGEEEFIRKNKELFSSRTVIIITHRPASLALADRILRLENGSFSLSSRSPLAKKLTFFYI